MEQTPLAKAIEQLENGFLENNLNHSYQILEILKNLLPNEREIAKDKRD